MNKKYFIEKKDLDLLPESYSNLGEEFAKNFVKIQKKHTHLNELKERINNLTDELTGLVVDNRRIYNQLKFIKKSYVPKIYLKVYRKNNNPQFYTHVVIRYFNISKTVYLGKRDYIISLLSDKIRSLNNRNFSNKLLIFLKPIIKSYCTRFTDKSSFVNCNISSATFFNNFDRSTSFEENKGSFSDYLKSLPADG